jgi:hypothetical protein
MRLILPLTSNRKMNLLYTRVVKNYVSNAPDIAFKPLALYPATAEPIIAG